MMEIRSEKLRSLVRDNPVNSDWAMVHGPAKFDSIQYDQVVNDLALVVMTNYAQSEL